MHTEEQARSNVYISRKKIGEALMAPSHTNWEFEKSFQAGKEIHHRVLVFFQKPLD